MAILLLKIADPLEVNKITIKCISQLDEIMEYGNKCVALMSKVLAVKDCNGIISTTSSSFGSEKWCNKQQNGIHMNPYHMRMNIIANIRCAE